MLGEFSESLRVHIAAVVEPAHVVLEEDVGQPVDLLLARSEMLVGTTGRGRVLGIVGCGGIGRGAVAVVVFFW